MAAAAHPTREHDVVALPERVGPWPAGTVGTAVSIYDDAALVEVAEDDPPGWALENLLPVPFERLELRWGHRTGWVDAMEA